jgi:hypothetical protein
VGHLFLLMIFFQRSALPTLNQGLPAPYRMRQDSNHLSPSEDAVRFPHRLVRARIRSHGRFNPLKNNFQGFIQAC